MKFRQYLNVAGSWGEALRQIGNAVPVRLAKIVGTKLRKLLEAESSVDMLCLSRVDFARPFADEEPRLAL